MRKIIILYLIIINLFFFIAVSTDKRIASAAYGTESNIKNRIAEVDFVTLSAFGGAGGTYLGFLVKNHKTSETKSYLRRDILLIFLQNIVVFAIILGRSSKKMSNRGKDYSYHRNRRY